MSLWKDKELGLKVSAIRILTSKLDLSVLYFRFILIFFSFKVLSLSMWALLTLTGRGVEASASPWTLLNRQRRNSLCRWTCSLDMIALASASNSSLVVWWKNKNKRKITLEYLANFSCHESLLIFITREWAENRASEAVEKNQIRFACFCI